jgi:hypothetical protein
MWQANGKFESGVPFVDMSFSAILSIVPPFVIVVTGRVPEERSEASRSSSCRSARALRRSASNARSLVAAESIT